MRRSSWSVARELRRDDRELVGTKWARDGHGAQMKRGPRMQAPDSFGGDEEDRTPATTHSLLPFQSGTSRDRSGRLRRTVDHFCGPPCGSPAQTATLYEVVTTSNRFGFGRLRQQRCRRCRKYLARGTGQPTPYSARHQRSRRGTQGHRMSRDHFTPR